MTVLDTKENVVTLRDTAISILYVCHKQRSPENTEDKKLRIIETAAKIIASDVKSLEIQNDFYPDTGDIARATNYIPNTVQVLLMTMLAGRHVDVKVASIEQAIMQAITSKGNNSAPSAWPRNPNAPSLHISFFG